MDSTGIMSTPSIRGTAEQLRSMVRECKEMAVKLSKADVDFSRFKIG
jgi:hypothetical protein